jgi:hypothetical protein
MEILNGNNAYQSLINIELSLIMISTYPDGNLLMAELLSNAWRNLPDRMLSILYFFLSLFFAFLSFFIISMSRILFLS